MCPNAAWGGHLDVLKWAREHHCPWDENTCMKAAESARLEVLHWAMEHGAPLRTTYLPYLQWYRHLLHGEPNAMDH
jgi:hypothetical protein